MKPETQGESSTAQREGWNRYYRESRRFALQPELNVVRLFRALIQGGDFLAEHGLTEWTLPASRRVLDFGCGNGRHLTFLAHERWPVRGCDVSATAIRLLGDPSAELITNGLPYRDGRFAIVLAHGVFDHIPSAERPQWIAEVRRVLQSGGLLVLSLISASAASEQVGERVLTQGDEAGLSQTFYDLPTLTAEYAQDGFTLRSVEEESRRIIAPADRMIERRLWAFLVKEPSHA